MLFVAPLVWVGLGAWLLAAGLGIRSQVEPVSGWPQTTGWVAGFHTYPPAMANEPAYRAVIAFRAAGHTVTFSAGVPLPPTVGAPARVAYDPRNPADAHDLSLGSYGEGQIYLGAGCLVLGIALTAFLAWLVFVRQKLVRPVSGEGRHIRVR
jgi:hypothetical protein